MPLPLEKTKNSRMRAYINSEDLHRIKLQSVHLHMSMAKLFNLISLIPVEDIKKLIKLKN